jgi:carbamate kinase
MPRADDLQRNGLMNDRIEALPQRLLVAIGGNAIHPDAGGADPSAEADRAASAARALLPLLLGCRQLVITHGNGPTVGEILLRQFHARQFVPPMSLDACVAASQGVIGYLIVQALENALIAAGQARPVAYMLTEVEVDANDPAFAAPSKPVGPFFSREAAHAMAVDGWSMMEDAGRGWRLAMPSPEPRAIVNLAAIDAALGAGCIVVAGGGGGIPVVRVAGGARNGVRAVIDKDLTSDLLARALGIDQLLILTSVPRIAIRFRQTGEQWLDTVSASQLRAYRDEGHFAPGSMGPKVDAALRFLGGGGRRVVIAHLDEAMAAMRGDAGTHVLPD